MGEVGTIEIDQYEELPQHLKNNGFLAKIL